ncbi:MAG TPA: PQQ-binding-like beta-propeller repeat protein [Actinoplanes sp.]|nr:PQQ-binding-like beta-propeller repeat protein [Actinoplanes sp.]
MTRVLVRSLLGLVVLAAAGLTGWRVLRPAEVLAPATDPYPAAVRRGPGVVGELASAPLIVGGRIRVFGAKRQVKADAPVDGKVEYTPRWSLRRWPQQVSGVVVIGSTVVSRWSDGQIVAIDGRTGLIAWRVDGPPVGGFRDAATAVWAPPGLVTAGTTVLITGGGRVRGLDVGTGAVRWQGDCRAAVFATRGGQFVCGAEVRDAATGAVLRGWPAGPFTALGCDVAWSGCRGLRDAAGFGWQTLAATPRRAVGLDVPGSTVFLELALIAGPSGLVARSAASGGELWRWAGPGATVLGSGQAAIYVLTADRQLVSLDASTGDVLAQVPLDAEGEPSGWQVADGYVAVAFPETVVLAAI